MGTLGTEPERTIGESLSPEEARESIWSIPPNRMAQYFGLFTLFASAGIGFLLWYEIFENTADTLPQTVLSIIQGIGLNTVGAAGLSMLTVEGPKFIMVMADYFTKKWLNPLKERLRAEREQLLTESRSKGRAEGRAERDAEWEAWNGRRMAADAKGEPFDEPPPGSNSLNR